MNPGNISVIIVAIACITALPCRAEKISSQPPGLYVHNGLLMKNDKPYQGIGVNYFSLFMRTLKNPNDTTGETGLRELSEAGIPFARFMCCGFWPVDWDIYLNDKDTYFQRLDKLVQTAEKYNVGLIPSLFWHTATVPDITGEPRNQLGNRNSKTIAFIRQYTTEIVCRYKDSPAIWGWEFGNEYNLDADLPNAAQHRPAVWPKLKTASERTERDELLSRDMLTAFDEFATTVRKYDKNRIIITGNSIPRQSAYHNTSEKSWKQDTLEQFRTVLLRDNPDTFNTICVHIYSNKNNEYAAGTTNFISLIRTVQEIAVNARKPLFIGEFGSSALLGQDIERATFAEILTAVETTHVPLSAFWVFDFSNQDKDFNVTFNNSRAYMLELICSANKRMKSAFILQKTQQ